MTTRRLREWMRDLPVTTDERDAIKLLARFLGPRLIIAFAVLLIWSWVRLHFVVLEPRSLDLLVELAGTALIFIVAVFPLLRVWLMSYLEPKRHIPHIDSQDSLLDESDSRP